MISPFALLHENTHASSAGTQSEGARPFKILYVTVSSALRQHVADELIRSGCPNVCVGLSEHPLGPTLLTWSELEELITKSSDSRMTVRSRFPQKLCVTFDVFVAKSVNFCC
jgi:hypothetical protein